MIKLAALNISDQHSFVMICGTLFEHSPWIAERAYSARPFATLEQLYRTLCDVVSQATDDEKLALIRAHPDLVGRLAREGKLTPASTGEQSAAGLSELTIDEAEQFDQYNSAYRERFGFPFVICARANKKDAILAAFPVRLQNDCEQEIRTALSEIYKVARLRLLDTVLES